MDLQDPRGLLARRGEVILASHGALPHQGAMARLILFNKPFGVLSQFTDRGNADGPRATLSDYLDVPGVYPPGGSTATARGCFC